MYLFFDSLGPQKKSHAKKQARAAVCYEVHLRDGVAGDIVAFYNDIFLPAVGPFVQSVVSVHVSGLAGLTASEQASPSAVPPRMAPRTVSCSTSLTLSTLKNRPKGVEIGGNRAHSMTYSFHSSLLQNLDEINRFVRDGKRKGESCMGESCKGRLQVHSFWPVSNLSLICICSAPIVLPADDDGPDELLHDGAFHLSSPEGSFTRPGPPGRNFGSGVTGEGTRGEGGFVQVP